jgi:uncharacterized protein YdiU (UPF0061 family)
MHRNLFEMSWNKRFAESFPVDPLMENATRQVYGALYSHVRPTPVNDPQLILWSESLAHQLGVAKPEPSSSSLALLGGNAIAEGMIPFASRYGGHQFGHWAGQLGDGRAISLGEIAAREGQGLWELQLKGAGPTPYSRQADGRAVLRSSIREYLASEAMSALGVPTTRALSLVLTGEKVLRDMFYDGNPSWEPGAIVCRVSRSFLRFGHFEILRACDEIKLMENLLNFVVRHFYPAIPVQEPDTAPRFYKELCLKTAHLVAHWMRVGFVHGVLNTDNMSLLGETIDYGPFGWIDSFDTRWTPNTTDFSGRRYCFGKQPQICKWNLARLGEALEPLFPNSFQIHIEEGLELFDGAFQRDFFHFYSRKLGLDLVDGGEEQRKLIMTLWGLLDRNQIDMHLFFLRIRQWWCQFISLPEEAFGSSQGPLKATLVDEVLSLSYATGFSEKDRGDWRVFWDGLFSHWSVRYGQQKQRGQVDHGGDLFLKENPQVIPRNFMLQEVIESATEGQYKPLYDLERILRRPYEPSPLHQPYQKKRPQWAEHRPGCAMLSCSS